MNVVLQPCANDESQGNFRKSIVNQINFSGVPVFRSIENVLTAVYPEGKATLWGVTLGDRNRKLASWRRIEPGDVALFSAERQIFANAVVTLTHRSRDIADFVWGRDSKDASYELLYFVKDVDRTHTIPGADLNRAVGYLESNNIQSFAVLDARRSADVIVAFPFLATRTEGVVQGAFDRAISVLGGADSLDRKVESLSRVEQTYLRQMLFGRESTSRCAICGEEFPVELLVAAHIKRRSACSLDERRDAEHIVMPACTFGCDELFERGFVGVDSTGRVVTADDGTTPTVAARLNLLRGRSCRTFERRREGYFSWHLENSFRGSS